MRFFFRHSCSPTTCKRHKTTTKTQSDYKETQNDQKETHREKKVTTKGLQRDIKRSERDAQVNTKGHTTTTNKVATSRFVSRCLAEVVGGLSHACAQGPHCLTVHPCINGILKLASNCGSVIVFNERSVCLARGVLAQEVSSH